MDQPSWQQRAQEQAEGDNAAVERFARDAEQRQSWNQLNPLDSVQPNNMFDDGRAGLPGSMRGEVYYLIGAVVLGLIGFVLWLLRGGAGAP